MSPSGSRRRLRGFTLFEVAIYLFLFAVASGIVLALFMTGRSTSEATTASYLVSGNAETALNWLRQDLKETALASIQPYPSGGASEPPGVSMVNARAFAEDKQGELLINEHGAPKWDKHVFYTLQVPAGSRTGTLIRWEKEMSPKKNLPTLASLRPSQLEGTHRRVMLHNVVAPGAKLPGVGPTGTLDAGPFGGLRVQFVRRLGGEAGAEELTTVNPSKGNPEDNTRLVEVELQVYQERGSRPNYYAIRFRVAPFH